jgi:hypothetical protein
MAALLAIGAMGCTGDRWALRHESDATLTAKASKDGNVTVVVATLRITNPPAQIECAPIGWRWGDGDRDLPSVGWPKDRAGTIVCRPRARGDHVVRAQHVYRKPGRYRIQAVVLMGCISAAREAYVDVGQ